MANQLHAGFISHEDRVKRDTNELVTRRAVSTINRYLHGESREGRQGIVDGDTLDDAANEAQCWLFDTYPNRAGFEDLQQVCVDLCDQYDIGNEWIH